MKERNKIEGKKENKNKYEKKKVKYEENGVK